MTDYRVVGTCSQCGGLVTKPLHFLSTRPPVASCESCGATAKTKLPVVEMESSKQRIGQLKVPE